MYTVGEKQHSAGTMTELPQFQPVEPSQNRLWKRVRTLESNLGYSNLAFESDNDHRPKNSWQTDVFEPSSRRRKRRLPRVGVSPKAQCATPPRQVQNSRSIPTLSSLPSEERPAPPWTQSVSQLACLGRGANLPHLSRPPHEVESSHSLEWPQETSMTSKLGAEETADRQQSVRDGRKDLHDTLSPGRPSRAHGMPSPVQSPPVVGSDRTSDDKVVCDAVFRTPTCEASQEEEGALGLSIDAQGRDESRDLEITPQVEPQGQHNFVVRALPPGKKLRAVRAGRFRSLVSPNNKVFSSTVVARVQQGLQNGDDEERPKVLIVGSGTFNPIHKIHIRRFYLARNFLQVHKGVSR